MDDERFNSFTTHQLRPPSDQRGRRPKAIASNKMARSSSGRTRDPQSRNAGSIPARVTNVQPSGGTGIHATLRTSCREALGVRISPWLLQSLPRVSQRSAGPHKPGPSGATPEPAMTRYANWQSDEVESLVFVSSTLTPVTLEKRSRGPTVKTPG